MSQYGNPQGVFGNCRNRLPAKAFEYDAAQSLACWSGDRDNCEGVNVTKRVEGMRTELSQTGNGHMPPGDSHDRRVDDALTQLYDEILAEPLSPALATLVARLRNIRSHS